MKSIYRKFVIFDLSPYSRVVHLFSFDRYGIARAHYGPAPISGPVPTASNLLDPRMKASFEEQTINVRKRMLKMAIADEKRALEKSRPTACCACGAGKG